jgi:hypothetical protein
MGIASLKEIPDDIKWRLASEYAARLPALYDRAFRACIGSRYDEIEQEIWMEVARTAAGIVKDLSLPVRTVEDLAETMRTVLGILFGPGLKSETLGISEEAAVILIKSCPLLSCSCDTGGDGHCTFRRCMALILTAIPRINTGFSVRFIRTMCTGDRQCEIKITRNGEAAPGSLAKK